MPFGRKDGYALLFEACKDGKCQFSYSDRIKDKNQLTGLKHNNLTNNDGHKYFMKVITNIINLPIKMPRQIAVPIHYPWKEWKKMNKPARLIKKKQNKRACSQKFDNGKTQHIDWPTVLPWLFLHLPMAASFELVHTSFQLKKAKENVSKKPETDKWLFPIDASNIFSCNTVIAPETSPTLMQNCNMVIYCYSNHNSHLVRLRGSSKLEDCWANSLGTYLNSKDLMRLQLDILDSAIIFSTRSTIFCKDNY